MTRNTIASPPPGRVSPPHDVSRVDPAWKIDQKSPDRLDRTSPAEAVARINVGRRPPQHLALDPLRTSTCGGIQARQGIRATASAESSTPPDRALDGRCRQAARGGCSRRHPPPHVADPGGRRSTAAAAAHRTGPIRRRGPDGMLRFACGATDDSESPHATAVAGREARMAARAADPPGVATTSAELSMSAAPGSELCVRIRARDVACNMTGLSAARSAAIVYADRVLDVSRATARAADARGLARHRQAANPRRIASRRRHVRGGSGREVAKAAEGCLVEAGEVGDVGDS
jgi:hypothetical protein